MGAGKQGGIVSRLILIQEDDYERQYRESRAYIDDKYFNHPTRLKNIPATDIPPGVNENQQGRARPNRTPWRVV